MYDNNNNNNNETSMDDPRSGIVLYFISMAWFTRDNFVVYHLQREISRWLSLIH